jgi:hypothetical protein
MQLKRNNFTSDSPRKDWVVALYVLSLRGLPLPPTCVFVTVIQARSYVAATVPLLRDQLSAGSEMKPLTSVRGYDNVLLGQG